MESILSFQEIGQGLPVLLIHGWEGNGQVDMADFEPVLAKLPGLRRIYVDLPGMGKTPGTNVKNLDDMYNMLVKFIDAKIGTSKFLLTGSSCGGYLARALAQKYTSQVDGLLLRVPLVEPKYSMRSLDTLRPLIENKELMASLSEEERKSFGDVPVQTHAYISALRAKIVNVYNPSTAMADASVLGPIRDDPERYQLSWSLDDKDVKFLAPTLILCGRHDDSVGYRDSLRLLELYPRSTYALLDRGIHGLPIDETGLFEALVRDWITRVHEWRETMKQQN